MNIEKSIATFLLLASFMAINPVICASTKATRPKNKEPVKTIATTNEKTEFPNTMYTKNKIPKKIEKQIKKIVNEPSNFAGFADFKRKTKQERIKDNIEWYKKHGEVNEEYNIYGLDIKNYRNQNDYLIGKDLNRSAVHHGNVNPKNHKKLLDNKLLFDNRVREHYPESLVDVYFVFKGKNIVPKQNTLLKSSTNTLSALKSLGDGEYFIKELGGLGGKNAIRFTKKDDKMNFRHVSKGEITLDDFWKITGKKEFLIQKRIENHKNIKTLSPTALSTVRIVTTRFNKNVHVLSCDLCLGCSKNSIVDNYNNEGAIVHVDEKTGKLGKYAFRKHSKIIDKHPVSGIKFENYQLPFWNESIELVKKLHSIFPEFCSIGWDVAITENGPLIIEGNYNWGYTIAQTTTGGLAKKWSEAHNI